MAKSEEKGPSWDASTNEASFNFDWIINDYSKVNKLTGESIISPDFGGDTTFDGVRCRVFAKFNSREETEESKGYLSMDLTLSIVPADPAYKIDAEYSVYILGCNGEKLATAATAMKEYNQINPTWGFPKYVLLLEFLKRRDEFLPDGNLTLHYEGKVRITFQKGFKQRNTPDHKVTTNIMQNLFQSGTCSDVVIKAGGQEFKCHKSVLSTRSEYFRTMFDSEMKENQEETVDFSEQMDGNVLKDLLEFLYLGKTSKLKETCRNMLKIAEMFQLLDLKSQAEEILIEQLNQDNAWDTMMLAHEHGAKKLQMKAHLILAESLPVKPFSIL